MPKVQVNYTGVQQTINIPKGVDFIIIKAWGAGGAKQIDDKVVSVAGGYCYGELHVKEGDEIKIYVGKAGGVINGNRLQSEKTYVSFKDDKPFLIAGSEGDVGFVDKDILENPETVENKIAYVYPPNNLDSDYIRGFAEGANLDKGQLGGNGFVVILFSFNLVESKQIEPPVKVEDKKLEPSINEGIKENEVVETYKIVDKISEINIEAVLNNDRAFQFKIGSLNAVQQVNREVVGVGDLIKYSIILTNEGNAVIENVVVSNKTGSYQTLELVELKQDDTEISIYKGIDEIYLPKEIEVGCTSTLTFSLKVIGPPRENPIENSVHIKYSYDNNGEIVTKTANANIVRTKINYANLGRCIKFLDKRYLTVGETAVYTILIPNTGNVTAHNILFKDTIPKGTVFVENSLRINGGVYYGASPLKGLVIPDIGPGQTTTIAFAILANG